MVCIYLFGAGGSGKTILANELLKNKKLRGLSPILQVPRHVLKELDVKKREGLEDYSFFYSTQQTILKEQCRLEKTHHDRGEEIISDHCVLDSLVHASMKINQDAAEKLISNEPMINESIQRYRKSLMVLLSPLPDVADDGVRIKFSDKELERLNRLYEKFCHQHKIPYVNLGCNSLEDRVEKIMKAVQGKLPLETSSLLNYSKKSQENTTERHSTNLSFYLPKPNRSRCISVPTITIKEHKSEQAWKSWEECECNRFIAKHGADDLVIIAFHVSVKSKVVQKMLLDGITINGEKYSFLGCSSSGLKKRKCYMLKGSCEEAHKMIEENGNFDQKSVSKRMARIALLFSAVRLTEIEIHENNVITEEDVCTSDNKCFTDGCGGIGQEIAKQIFTEVSRLSEEEGYLPSVYQIRYQGYKGVLALDPTLPDEAIKVRPSMKKFETSAHGRMGVCGFSRPHTFGHLNRQYIMLLSGLGVADKVFKEKQRNLFAMVENMTLDLENAISILQWQNKFELAQRLMRHRGRDEPIGEELLKGIRKTQSKLVSVSQKLRILIPNSRNIYGVCDPTGTLEYGQCFVRITEGNVGSPKTIKGQVVVSKNPCYLLGDVRVLTAVDSPEAENLNHLVDCIVFPVRGKRPHPDEIAGSDLDGDMFFVSWDSNLVPPQTKPPYDYPGAEVKPQGNITLEKMVKYFADQNESQKLTAQVDRNFLEWANIKGVDSEECRSLGMLFSRVIDSAKSGEKFDSKEFMAPNTETLQSKKQTFVWEILENNAIEFKKKFAERVVKEFSADVDEEFVRDIASQEMTNISEFEKFEFVWSYISSITGDSEEKVDIFLEKYADRFNFALFSIEQKREAIGLGIPADVIINALGKSKLLSKDDLNVFAMNSSPNKWKFYFREDHEYFNWTYLLKALTHHDRCLVVIGLPDEVTIVLQFLTKQEEGEKQQVTPGTVSGYFYSKRFQYREKYVLGSEYTLDLTENRLQLYRNQVVSQTFVWLRATDKKKGKRLEQCDEVLNSISVDLTRFRRNILNERRHPLVNKIPLVTIEVFVDNNSLNVPYFDTMEANDLEPVAETEDVEAEEDYKTERDLSYMLSEDDLNIHDSCETEESLKTSLKRTVTEGKPLLFKRLNDEWRKRTSKVPSCLSELVVSLLENIVAMSTPQDLAEEVKESLRNIVLSCEFRQPNQVFTMAKYLSRIHLEDAAMALLIRDLDNCEIDISSFLDIFSNWQIWWYIKRDIALQSLSNVAKVVSACQSSKEMTSEAVNRIKYVLHFGQLHFLDLLQEMESVKERLKSEKADFSICNLKLKITTREDDYILSFSRATSLTHRPRITQGQFVAVTRQADFKKLKDHEASCCLAQVESIRLAPLTVTVKLFGQIPAIISDCLMLEDSRLWKIDLIANITTFTRVMNALKRLTKTEKFEPLLLNLLANPAGHPKDSPLFSDKTHMEMIGKETIAFSELDISRNLNVKQIEAVHAALEQNLTLIQGPPGTGKTTLACEIIKQAHKLKKHKKILVVAETNVAVDNIAKKLRKDLPLDILRLGTEGGVDHEVYDLTLDGQLKQQEEMEARKSSYRDEHGITHRKPKMVEKILAKAGIFLTTCAGAGDSLLDSCTFDFVLVDEATQSKETTLLCSLAHGVKHLVMIGDPKQLGPVTVEPHDQQALSSKELPDVRTLSKTLFHRLYDVIPSEFLDTQHRMHPQLMTFPSQVFYDGKLECGATPSCHVPVVFKWPDPTKPLCFINVESKEQKNGTSFCNLEEARVIQCVLDVLLKVPKDKQLMLDVSEIGILTLYQGQAKLLSNDIKPKVEVRTVDGFQGREKEAIIVSTVRANERGALGFLDSTNRLNVLLTRARRGLIIVGNERTLMNSQLWKKWIDDAPKLDHNSLVEAPSSERQATVSFPRRQTPSSDRGNYRYSQGRQAVRLGRDNLRDGQGAQTAPVRDNQRVWQGPQAASRGRDSQRDGQGAQTAPVRDNQRDGQGQQTASRRRNNHRDGQGAQTASRRRNNQRGGQDPQTARRGRENQRDRQGLQAAPKGKGTRWTDSPS